MKHAVVMALCAAAFAPLAAQAEITGAEVGAQYSTFGDADARDAHKATLGGSLEYAITPQFSMQGDLAQRYYGFASWKGNTATAHATFHPSMDTAVGGFVGKDWMSKDNGGEFYGLEAKQSFGQFSVEGYGQYLDADKGVNDGYGYGARVDYMLDDLTTVGAKFDTMNTEMGMPSLAATGSYQFGPGYLVNGSVGYADPNNSDKEVYVTLGVKATFGGSNNSGVTFGGRGVQETLIGR